MVIYIVQIVLCFFIFMLNDSFLFLSYDSFKVLEYLQKTKTLKMTFFLGQSFTIGLK